MARRRTAPQDGDDGDLILPFHLVDESRQSGAEYRQQWQERRQWLLERGIDPREWRQVYPVLKASWAEHGIPDTAERVRQRLRIADPDLRDEGRAP